MNIRARIIEYLNFKGISKYKFYQDLKLSNGFLDKTGAIGSDKCEQIINYYDDLSLDWLMLGIGSMLKNPALMDIWEMDQHDKEVAQGKWHHHSNSEKDVTTFDLYNNRIISLENEIVALKTRIAELIERLAEQKETITTQRELIDMLKKTAPKSEQTVTHKSPKKTKV